MYELALFSFHAQQPAVVRVSRNHQQLARSLWSENHAELNHSLYELLMPGVIPAGQDTQRLSPGSTE